jgi:membrane protein
MRPDWKSYIETGERYLKLYAKRCKQDDITIIGGYLAYISLLSLVPLIAVMFSMLRAFPIFNDFRQSIESFVYANVIPSRGDELQTYISQFIGNAGGMTAVGITALVLVALLLIHNIDKTLNKIWRVTKRPRPIISFSIYWMILTLGPVLVGSSIALSSYVAGLTRFADDYTPGVSSLVLGLLPLMMSMLAFYILYLVVPNVKVKSRHALAGALLATMLFELSKHGFTFYITHFPSYDKIYGALALVPILFVWVYLSWLVVLLGAELTALLQQIAADNEPADPDDPDQNIPEPE